MPRRKKDEESSNKLLYFPLFAERFLTDTTMFSDAEVGFYFRLLCHEWLEGPLMNDPRRLAMLPGGQQTTLQLAENIVPAGTPVFRDGEHSGTHPVPQHGNVLSQDRLIMWEVIKSKFMLTERGLQNPRLEKERDKVTKYLESQRIKSAKGVAARQKKRKELAAYMAKQQGQLIDVPVGTPEVVPQENPLKDQILVLGSLKNESQEKGSGGKHVPAGTPQVHDKYTNRVPKPVAAYYRMSFEELQSHGDAKKVTQDSFDRWKSFVRFIVDGEYEDVFKAKFIMPKDFAAIEAKGLTPTRYREILDKLLAYELKPDHNLFWRIPEVINWLEKKGPAGTQATGKLVANPKAEQEKANWMKEQKRIIKEKLDKQQISPQLHDYLVRNISMDTTIALLIKKFASAKPGAT